MNREYRDRSSLIQSFLDVGDYAETSWTLPIARPKRRPRAEFLKSGNEVQGPYQLVRDSRVAGLRVPVQDRAAFEKCPILRAR